MPDVGDADPAVALRGLTKSFGTTEVLRELDLDVSTGSVTALLGPSGCGKTTVLRIVAGLESPDRGTVSIAGAVVSGPGTHVETEHRRIGMIFQNGALFPHLTVARNVGYGLERSQRRGGPRVDEMLELVGLAGFGERSPDSLSGGQAQRVALARALAPAPSVVLMDEPFSNLDAVLRARLRREVADVVRAAGVTVLLVTHDRDEAFSLADRVAVMRDGRIVQAGAPRDLYRRPADRWVAAFVGDVNLLPASRRPGDPGSADTVLGAVPITDAGDGESPAEGGESGEVVIRPEDLEVSPTGTVDGRSGVLVAEEYLGDATMLDVRIDEILLRVLARGDAVGTIAVGSTVGVRRRGDVAPAMWLRVP